MASQTGTDCSKLQSLNDFNDYIGHLKSETAFRLSALDECQHQICHAIWGENNPDISGIGVSIGYAVELGLGFLLAVFVMAVRQKQGPRWEFAQLVAKAGLEAFFDFAIYFAIAVQLASIVMLVNKDFGISTAGFGANEAQVALAISVVCVLPLVYPAALLPTRLFHPQSERQRDLNRKEEEAEKRQDFRLMLFAFLCVLFFYPFLSQCIHNWAPLRVGEGNGPGGETIITGDEWARIQDMCFGAVERFTVKEHWLLAICEITASISVFLFVLWQAIGVGIRRLQEEDRYLEKERGRTVVLSRTHEIVGAAWGSQKGIQVLLLFFPLVLGGALLWCIFRLRTIQAAAAERMGNEYAGNQWGFGQIVGLIIFAPVPTEMVFAAWGARSLLGVSDYDAVSSNGTV